MHINYKASQMVSPSDASEPFFGLGFELTMYHTVASSENSYHELYTSKNSKTSLVGFLATMPLYSYYFLSPNFDIIS